MKRYLTFIIAITSICAVAKNDNNIPLNTEIEDTLPVMSQYLERAM